MSENERETQDWLRHFVLYNRNFHSIDQLPTNQFRFVIIILSFFSVRIQGCLPVRHIGLCAGNIITRPSRCNTTISSISYRTRFGDMETWSWLGPRLQSTASAKHDTSSTLVQIFTLVATGEIVKFQFFLLPLFRYWSWMSRRLYENSSWI